MKTTRGKRGHSGPSFRNIETFLFAGLALAATACGSGQAEEAPAIQTTAAERRDLRITAEATGSVEPSAPWR